MILSLVRFIVSNKTARLVVFFYSVLLHGLVFAVLYKLVLTESCRQAIRKFFLLLGTLSGMIWQRSGTRNTLNTWRVFTTGKSMQDNDRHVVVVITPITIMSIPTKIFHYVWMNIIAII